MPIEITVAPPGITISQGRTFMATDQRGPVWFCGTGLTRRWACCTTG